MTMADETPAERVPEDRTPGVTLETPVVPETEMEATPTAEQTQTPAETNSEATQQEVKVEKPPTKKITVHVKTAQEKETFEVEEDAPIKDFKELISPKFNAEPEQLCLIFAGKIMNDGDTLVQHNVKDGLTIHLVVRAAPRTTDAGSQRPPADISATPFQLGSLGGLAGLAQLGMGSANFMDIQNQMQNELLSNPNVLRELLDNPLVQQLMNNPEVMRTLITRNPQMQDLIER